MNNANSEAFIINNCLFSGSLTLLSADVTIKGSPWAKTEGRCGQSLEEMAGQDWSPPISDEGWFDTGDSRNRQSICRRNCDGGRNCWILNLVKLDQTFSLGIEEEQPLETLKVIGMT